MTALSTTMSPAPTTPPLCVVEPSHDENAIEACSWFIDTDSPFHVSRRMIMLW